MQVRAGVEARVNAAMTHGSLVQAELDGINAVHEQQLSMLRSQIAELQELSHEQQQQLSRTHHQLGHVQDTAARCGNSSALKHKYLVIYVSRQHLQGST